MSGLPSSRSTFLRLIVDHNPFYLLSAACMLAGCLALTNSLSWNPIARQRLLILIATINVYEFALIGLALFLITRRRLVRDGRILLVLAVFFLVDVTFLNAEIATDNFRIGMVVNGVLFLLALFKLGAVIHVLRPRMPWQKIAFVAIQIALLFAMPSIFAWIDLAAVRPKHFYAAWWALGMLPAVHELLRSAGAGSWPVGPPDSSAAATPVRAYLVLPWVSLLVHLGILHYVHDVHFHVANVAPLLLGLTLVVHRARPTVFVTQRDIEIVRGVLPAVAVLMSLNSSYQISFMLWKTEVTPLMLAATGAYLTYVYCLLLPLAIYFIAGGLAAALLWMFGPSPAEVGSTITAAMRAIAEVCRRVVPRAAHAWGLIGVAAAFVFLAIGAAISLGKRDINASAQPGPGGPGPGDS